MRIVEEASYRFRIEPEGRMRVPGIVFASRALLPHAEEDKSLQQVCNAATLPGIVGASYAMPDMHWGYGFPIGGVAATDVAHGPDPAARVGVLDNLGARGRWHAGLRASEPDPMS